MINAWSLLYDEYYGTMNETFPVNKKEPDDTVVISTGSTESAGPHFVNFDLNDQIENITIDTSNFDTVDFSNVELPDGMSINYDMDPDLCYMEPGTEIKVDTDYADTWPHAETFNIKMPDDYPQEFTTLSDNDDQVAECHDDEEIKRLLDLLILSLRN